MTTEPKPQPASRPSENAASRRLLITAGPTHEPIDRVRYIGNRSSGRLGIALADEAALRGWKVTLLLGPTPLLPSCSHIEVQRFRTTAELQTLLATHFPGTDVLVMAAAVADFRPRPLGDQTGKVRRSDGPVVLHLDPTPDLLAGCGKTKKPGQSIVGFALEPESRLLDSARDKLSRKGADMIVGNPLETMDTPTIRATLVRKNLPDVSTPGEMNKDAFAAFLMDEIERMRVRGASGQ